MKCSVDWPTLPNQDSMTSVRMAAGTLPQAMRRTIRQSTVSRLPWTTEPAILVVAANRRSVPTAVCGLTPNSSTSSGVISEPPPTPVSPTNTPTSMPAKTCR